MSGYFVTSDKQDGSLGILTCCAWRSGVCKTDAHCVFRSWASQDTGGSSTPS